MSQLPPCPKCASEFTYRDGGMFMCPSCAYEWSESDSAGSAAETDSFIVRDANGNVLKDGDSVVVIKDLKVRGASSAIKVGTKVREIRLIDPNEFAGHNIDCKIEGFGAMQLKSEFVKKA